MNKRFSLSFIFSIIFHSLLFGTIFLLGATNIIKSEPIFIMSLNSLQESHKDMTKKVNESDNAKTSEKNITEQSLEKIHAKVQTINATNLSFIQTKPVNTSNPVNSNGSLSNNSLESANQRVTNENIYSRSFGSSDGPKFLKRIIPEYPLREKRLGIEGKVVLELLIDENGRLISVKVLESTNDDFSQAALRAVRASSFRAATENGAFVRSRAILPIRFVLED